MLELLCVESDNAVVKWGVNGGPVICQGGRGPTWSPLDLEPPLLQNKCAGCKGRCGIFFGKYAAGQWLSAEAERRQL